MWMFRKYCELHGTNLDTEMLFFNAQVFKVKDSKVH